MGLFKDAPPREHPDYTQLRFMAAGSPSWWKSNRHKVLAVTGLLVGFWLAGQHDTAPTPATCPAPPPAASTR
ncbi:hypothetical protein F4556_007243 [Kitasatospora gansuensis]|uniref:Uncharacterized protein n=1 Tax=Kitasatospora gansuensis TaxID=258050 RepID=A0A7W7SJP1_9ACTN|nr:hypothetical protein [Kitasatospora gansuensis]MBB4951708.1 hypothetical protein [Kitasatospora gansuensis]